MIQNNSPEINDSPENSTPHTPSKKKGQRKNPSSIGFVTSNSAKAETAMWIAVITQAMMDALSKSRKSEAQFYKHEAINWLTGNSAHFIMVCELAGLHPDDVRKKAKRALISPKNWRMEAGKGSRYEERKAYRNRIKKKP